MIIPYNIQTPKINKTARIAYNATLVGSVTLSDSVSIWYGAVLRGDASDIFIGDRSNIQEQCVLHCDIDCPLSVGKNVTVGHGVILHGCTVEDDCLIGMGSTLLNGCTIGKGSMIGAGSLVTQGTVIPSGMLAMGRPAKVIRPLSSDEIEHLSTSADVYCELAKGQLDLI